MRNKIKQLLTLALFASTCQIASAYSFVVDGIYYNILSSADRTVEVTSSNETAYEGNIVIPQTVSYDDNEYSIERIGSSAFYGCSSLSSVDLSACTSIGDYAFYGCKTLTTFTIPSSVINIENGAFDGCTGIKTLVFEDGEDVLNVGYGYINNSSAGLFESCPLESIYLGRNLSNASFFNTKYGPFRNQQNLVNVEISRNVTFIDGCTFSGCSSLSSVGDLSACTSIGDNAFSGCFSLSSVGDLSACTSIGYQAFSGCSSLSSVGDLSACTSIGNWAFYYCSSLTSVGDLSACTSIGERVFQYCSSLSSVGDLSACTSIGDNAFYNCSSLPRVSISAESVVTLSSTNAFSSATTVLVPNNLLADYKAANGWKDMASRIIAIGSEPAVEQYVTMQENSSGIHAAIGEENLANVIELKVIGDINSYDIGIIRDKMPNLHYLDLSEARIKTNAYKYYSSYSTKDDELGSYAFYQMDKLIKVALPETLKKINVHSFAQCSCLKEVKNANSIQTIDSYAFDGCSNLTAIELPSSLTIIDYEAFYNCSKLPAIELPANLTKIGGHAFSGCSSLKSVLFAPNSKLSSVGDYAFYYCYNLPSIELPSSVTAIGASAFSGCSALSEIYLPASLKSVGNNAFASCSNLRSVYATAPNAYDVTIVDETFIAATREQGTLYVPFDEETGWDATYKTYYWQTQWKRFLNIAKWRPEYDRFPIDSDYDQETGTIPGEEIDANFGTNAGYILGEEAYQHFKTVVLKCNASKGGSIIVKGNKNISIGELFPEIEVSGNKWYFFCFPFDIKLSDVTCGADGRFVFRKYDSAARAEGGSGWTNLAADEEWLKAGVGYIFQCNKAGTLRLPILDPQFADADKSPELEAHPAANDQDASWNFVGNPYLSYYQLEDLGFDAPVTYWNGTSYVAVRPGDDDYVFQPYQAFFVQKPTDAQTVGFDGAQQQTYTQSQTAAAQVRERRAHQRINPDRLIINVTLSDGENTDRTRVVYNNEKSANYEMACDAAKFMSTEAVPQLFTVGGDVQYAINERPQGEVELGFKAPKAGTYTIRMARMDAPMLLKDLKTGVTFDFTIGEDYVFEAEAGTCTNRFVLLLNPNTNRIENMTIADAENAQFYNLAGQRTDGDSDAIQIMKQGESAKKVMIK